MVRRVGVDIEPLDLDDAGVRAWLAACVPQEIGAVTRFERATRVARSQPVQLVRGEALAVLPEILAAIPDDVLVCLTDSYVHVFFEQAELGRFREFVDLVGAKRDIDWISLDPLIPLGPSATDSVIGVPVPRALVERNRDRGRVRRARARQPSERPAVGWVVGHRPPWRGLAGVAALTRGVSRRQPVLPRAGDCA